MDSDQTNTNMAMLKFYKRAAPLCPQCGYFQMQEIRHVAIMMPDDHIGGKSFYNCPNCGYESDSESIGDSVW